MSRGIEAHAGRLAIMTPGVAGLGYSLVWANRLPTVMQYTAPTICGGLILAGYLAPVIKSFVINREGFRMETREPSQRIEENRERTAEITTGQDKVVDIDDGDQEIVEFSRVNAADAALTALLNTGGLDLCDSTIYVPADGQLVPFFSTVARPFEEQPPWPIGRGAVGTAYRDVKFVLAAGDEARDETYGLDADQQSQHATLDAVAAIPIVDGDRQPIGVLAASARGHDALCFMESDAAFDVMAKTSLSIARVLIDLLGLYFDSEDLAR